MWQDNWAYPRARFSRRLVRGDDGFRRKTTILEGSVIQGEKFMLIICIKKELYFDIILFFGQSTFFHLNHLSRNKTFIQKKILNTDILNAIVIPPWLHIVSYDYDFLEGIGDSDQGGNLLILFFRIRNRQS